MRAALLPGGVAKEIRDRKSVLNSVDKIVGGMVREIRRYNGELLPGCTEP